MIFPDPPDDIGPSPKGFPALATSSRGFWAFDLAVLMMANNILALVAKVIKVQSCI